MTHDIVSDSGQGTALVPVAVGNRTPGLRTLLRSGVELAFDVADELVDRLQGLVVRR